MNDPDGGSVLTSEVANILTTTVSIQVLKVGRKQMTQAVFRQLINEPILSREDGGLQGHCWGRINYHWDCGLHAPHLHVVWQKGQELRRSCVLSEYVLTEQEKNQDCETFKRIESLLKLVLIHYLYLEWNLLCKVHDDSCLVEFVLPRWRWSIAVHSRFRPDSGIYHMLRADTKDGDYGCHLRQWISLAFDHYADILELDPMTPFPLLYQNVLQTEERLWQTRQRQQEIATAWRQSYQSILQTPQLFIAV
jgi:hypothetical protein